MVLLILAAVMLGQTNGPRPTPMPWELVGVLLDDVATQRAAVFRNTGTGRTLTLREDDRLDGHRVLHIARGRVLLERLELVLPGPSRPAWVEKRGAPAAPEGCGVFRIPREEFTAQQRIVPEFEAGVQVGFKVFSIRPNSFLDRLGIKNGDSVRRVNGIELNSPERALEIYSNLRQARSITLALVRDGKRIERRCPLPEREKWRKPSGDQQEDR